MHVSVGPKEGSASQNCEKQGDLAQFDRAFRIQIFIELIHKCPDRGDMYDVVEEGDVSQIFIDYLL